ncbi:ribbon-helix-helix protein, CopG family [Variovorax sp. PBL-E5]|uniref:ribbon-helix-helix protein, CopG family n=1 Tax=Variovorax sp. PBL-E5 TaxID=434014 RepID=UPI0013179BBF|nr:hypothetical protein E5P2_00533 [Variovorax sp. PBL-E5]
MELKNTRLTLLIDSNRKKALERLCALKDRTASQVVRQPARNYLSQHGVQYLARCVSEFPLPPTFRRREPSRARRRLLPSIARRGPYITRPES